MYKRILITSSHPDDTSLMCGGTVKRFSSLGSDVHMINFTNGGDARLKSVLGGSGEDRRHLLKDECKILGIKNYKSYSFPDNKLDTVPFLDLVQSIEEYISVNNFVPDLVITHNPWCLNIDHKKIYEATLTCFRGLEKYNKTTILSAEVVSSSEWNPLSEFKPNFYIDISKTIAYKCKALEVYESELRPLPHPRNIQTIIDRAKVNGTECGVEYAERFMVIRQVI